MATATVLLMRDYLQDDGSIPSHGSYCASPDLICHSQVADPETFFTNNYAQDPNEKVQLDNAVNLIYTRVKNITSSKQGGYIHVYRANSSLFMQPSKWKNNKLQTIKGNSYVTVDAVDSTEVAVGNEPFLVSGLNNNLFCMVGIVTTGKEQDIPQDFKTYDDFVVWVRVNQNVCLRNFSLETNCQKLNYERFDEFSNPQDSEVVVVFQVTTKNLAAGTTFGVKCDPIITKTSQTIEKGTELLVVGKCAAHFEGIASAFGILPKGVTKWPDNATILIEVYVGIKADSPARIYAESWKKFTATEPEMKTLMASNRLVRVGSCLTQFRNS